MLRVYEGVAVDLRGGGEHKARPPGAGQPEGVVGTQCAGPEYLYGDASEIGRARGGGEMVDFVELAGNVYVDTDVVVYVLEVRLARQERGYILERASTEVVHAGDLVALEEEPLAEVAPYETRPSRNQRPRHYGGRPSPCHGHVRSPCTGVLPPVRLQHRGRYGRPRSASGLASARRPSWDPGPSPRPTRSPPPPRGPLRAPYRGRRRRECRARAW